MADGGFSLCEKAVHWAIVLLLVSVMMVAARQHTPNLAIISVTCLLFVVQVMVLFLRWNMISGQRAREELLDRALLAHEQSAAFRIEGTVKEAQEGFNRCLVCEFENFKRTKYCSICGEPVATSDETSGNTNSSSSKRSKRNKNKDSTNFTTHQTNTRTKRQIRARKRKEWQRKLDEHGRPFWHREPLAHDLNPNTSMPGMTVEFTLEPIVRQDTQWDGQVVIDIHEQNASGQSNKPLTTGRPNQRVSSDAMASDIEFSLPEDRHPGAPGDQEPEAEENTINQWISIPEVVKNNRLGFSVIDAASADPSRLPNGEMIHSTKYQEMLVHSAMDFPSRYSHFVAHTSSSMCPAEVAYMRFKVHRDYVFEESMDHMSCVKSEHIRSIMRIKFLGESGVDAGGVHREWFMLLNERLVDKKFGLFRCTNVMEQSYYLNPNSEEENGEDHLVYYYGVGRLVGRALLEGSVFNFHFAVPLLKLILGTPVTFDDLEYLDGEAYRGLLWLLENKNVGDLGLTFTVCELYTEEDGHSHMKVVNLIPNGREVDVTDANKHEFVQRKFEYLVFGSVSSQLHMFLRGVYEVIPLELLMLFDHEELDYILCGEQDINVDEWRKHTDVSSNLCGTSTLQWFWEIVEEMPMEYRSRLLQFATGSSRLPASGFEGLTSYDGRLCRFSIKGIRTHVWRDRYIQGHACFNRIDLPFFWHKDDLSEMLYAILDADTYGFTES